MSANEAVVERVAEAIARASGYSWFTPEEEEKFALKRSQDGFRHKARAALAASPCDELAGALAECAATFRQYEKMHEAKIQAAGSISELDSIRRKVARNREMAERCEAALTLYRETNHG